MNGRRLPTLCVLFVGLALAGCSNEVDTTYGRRKGPSVNGTGVFAELLREQGHTVRTAVRLSDSLEQWADVVVRFAPYPGPPEKEEAQWYTEWLASAPGRMFIYVPHDYEAQLDYWKAAIAGLPQSTSMKVRERADKRRDEAARWADRIPHAPKQTGDANDWFAVNPPAVPPVVCKTLGGPWSVGVDAVRAAITRRQTPKVDAETVLLTGDDQPLAIEWTRVNESKVLVVANGSFLLNAGLANRDRRPLGMRVVRWLGEEPKQIAFVEGWSVKGEPAKQPSVFALLAVPPFGWVAAQLLVLGLAACLARAPRLGRPRAEPPSGADRAAAHPEALGDLMAKTGKATEARVLLEAYRAWRGQAGRGKRPATSAAAGPEETPSQVEPAPVE